MALTPQQLAALKADVLANADTLEAYNNGNLQLLADLYSAPATPAFKVWRTSVSRAEIYNKTSDESTNWNWTFYKNQNATEQNAWVQMFMGDQADFSRANLRAGIAVIFTSASVANATHALAIGKRSANRVEKLFATGAGSTASPATMVIQGSLSYTVFINL